MKSWEEEDVALKFLHTADWHLGKPFRSFDEVDEIKLTRARLDVLDKILGVAQHYSVDAVLCAGDLFDDPFPTKEWTQPVVELFQKRNWKNRPVFLLPGNHDPYINDSVWWPDHSFRIFPDTDRPRCSIREHLCCRCSSPDHTFRTCRTEGPTCSSPGTCRSGRKCW